ncbi:YheC/YheD family endospore coat-associated protein [Peribacillus huizhouensis]|uniref:YheC/YheD family protein n=1 Tax=Peribacillus huizhouensis TaxID=1501239 RepID=A0ABR6CL60_9BACI|nr:YheC/YheD family protein [Peribacillus huizhouensis]MBA9025290.1 hypothetical protein [Peribacillus huizhouensis]
MISLGIMLSELSKEQRYSTEIAKRASKNNLKVFRFKSSSIDIANKTLQGESYNPQANLWEPEKFPIPTFIYDRSFHGLIRDDQIARKKITWLKEQAQFLGHGLPSKWQVYSELKDLPLLQAYLPQTSQATDAETIWNHLHKNEQILLKPLFGSRGIGIYLLSKVEDGTLVTMTKQEKRYERNFKSKQQLLRWIESLLKKFQFLIQPYLPLFNLENEPFDLRILLQKDANNQWVEQGRGIRQGNKGCITSNLATGGKIITYEKFINQIDNPHKKYIELTIGHLLRTLPEELESRFQPLFELGIDLGIDQKNRVWILDINSKPGRKIIETLQPEKKDVLYEAPIAYCKYLSDNLVKAGEFNEENLSI